jgi:hypothetical protein
MPRTGPDIEADSVDIEVSDTSYKHPLDVEHSQPGSMQSPMLMKPSQEVRYAVWLSDWLPRWTAEVVRCFLNHPLDVGHSQPIKMFK